MSNLLRLIYVSRFTGIMELETLEALLAQARINNARVGLSGILCAGRGYFVQVLEGPANEVVKTYARIMADERHRESSLLSIGLVTSRLFADWAMAHVEGKLLGDEVHAGLIDQIVLERDVSESIKLFQNALMKLRHAA